MHGIDGQDARLLATLHNGHSGIRVYVGPVEQPGDIHGQIAQVDQTIHRDGLLKVDGMIAKVKVCDFRGHFVGNRTGRK